MVLTPAEYESLSEHLVALQPFIDAFCLRHGFVEQKTALGRYPRRRINRVREVSTYIDLGMDLDEHGACFESFFPEVPYSMGAGAWFDVGKTRCGKGIWCFRGLPFCELLGRFEQELENALSAVDGWNREYLEGSGERSPIA